MVLHSKREGKRSWTDYWSTAQLAVTEKNWNSYAPFFFNKILISNSAQILFAVLDFIQPTETKTGYNRGCETLAGTQENGNVRYGTEKLNSSSSRSTWTTGFKESAIAGGIVRSPVFRTPKWSLQLLFVAANIVLLKVTSSFRGGILKHGLRRIENSSMQLSIRNPSKDKTK